ncbi:MAG: RNA methyltransferase [Solitalea-like symbiont of Acarus siro]
MIVVLDNVRSMHNVGSLFRTCDAFMVESICLCGITATPPHREIEKTALGATKSVDWRYYTDSLDAIKFLKKNGYTVCAVEQFYKSVLIQDFNVLCDIRYALVFGNEVTGINQNLLEVVDYIIEIPHIGTKKSFNVSVAAGIALWNFFIKAQSG